MKVIYALNVNKKEGESLALRGSRERCGSRDPVSLACCFDLV